MALATGVMVTAVKPTDRKRTESRLFHRLRKTVERWELLQPGDRIMVAVSGGKDSYVMLHLLHAWRRRLASQVDLVAVHLDQVQPGYDGRPLQTWLEDSGYPYEILREDTYTVVTERLAEGTTYCSLCSRLRRGILYTAAERLGCNKIALGHHQNDALETFLLNLFYAGKLQTMPAVFTTDDGRFEVIRPLLECDEPSIAALAQWEGFPIVPCNLCGSQDGLQRQRMAKLLGQLEADHPNLRAVMMNALGNIRPSHMLDADVLEAWRARPSHVRPDPEPVSRAAHAAATPVARGGRRLPLLSPPDTDGR